MSRCRSARFSGAAILAPADVVQPCVDCGCRLAGRASAHGEPFGDRGRRAELAQIVDGAAHAAAFVGHEGGQRLAREVARFEESGDGRRDGGPPAGRSYVEGVVSGKVGNRGGDGGTYAGGDLFFRLFDAGPVFGRIGFFGDDFQQVGSRSAGDLPGYGARVAAVGEIDDQCLGAGRRLRSGGFGDSCQGGESHQISKGFHFAFRFLFAGTKIRAPVRCVPIRITGFATVFAGQ